LSGIDRKPPHPPAPAARAALRWLVAAAIGGGTSIALFVGMAYTFGFAVAAIATAIDAVDIVERMFRIFPLTQTILTDADACASDEISSHRAVPIEGVVGFWRGETFIPLADAEVTGENAVTGAVPVEVGADGAFRFVAAFTNEAAAACGPSSNASPGMFSLCTQASWSLTCCDWKSRSRTCQPMFWSTSTYLSYQRNTSAVWVVTLLAASRLTMSTLR